MKNDKYWEKRAARRFAESEAYTKKELEKITLLFEDAQKDLQKMIDEVYQSYGKNTGLDREMLEKIVNSTSAIKLIKETKKKTGIDITDHIKMNYKGRITRLQALQEQIRARNELLKGQIKTGADRTLKTIIETSYQHTKDDTNKIIELPHANFATLDDLTINAMLKTKWVGEKNYSQRIWSNINDYSNKLQAILVKGAVSGASYERMSADFRRENEIEKYKIDRLIRTEMNYFHNQAELQAYNDLGVEYFRFFAVYDSHTCDVCQQLDGKEFLLKDAKVGTNYPPMHPNCRSTVIPSTGKGELKLKKAVNPKTGEQETGTWKNYEEWKFTHATPEEKIKAYEKKLASNKSDIDKIQKVKYDGIWKSGPKGVSDFQDWDELKQAIKAKESYYNSKMAEWEANKPAQAQEAKEHLKELNELRSNYMTVWTKEIEQIVLVDKINQEKGTPAADKNEIEKWVQWHPENGKKLADAVEIFSKNTGISQSFILKEYNIGWDRTIREINKIVESQGGWDKTEPVKVEPVPGGRKDDIGHIKMAYDTETFNMVGTAPLGKDAYKVDKVLRPQHDKFYKKATIDEKKALYEYTRGSGGFNRPLSGYDGDWYTYKGVGKVKMSNEGDGYVVPYKKAIDDLTNFIQKTSMENNMRVVRGSDPNGLAGWISNSLPVKTAKQWEKFLGNATEKQLKQLLEGQVIVNHAFTSTGIAEGRGFGGKIQYYIDIPKGAHAIYAEPQSYYGDTISGRGFQEYKPGMKYSSIGGEAELIIQRETSFLIKSIESDQGYITVYLEIVEQW